MSFRRSHRASPKGARRWRLYRAFEYVLGIGKMISHKLSILIGDYCFLGLLHRECLSLLRAFKSSLIGTTQILSDFENPLLANYNG